MRRVFGTLAGATMAGVLVASGAGAGGAARAQEAGGGRSAPVALPRMGGQPQQAAEPTQQAGGDQRRTVEAEGTGPTETEARSSAVRAAIEHVAGVYLESSRRSELAVSGSQVRDTFNERVVAHSNGFVERVTTLQSSRTPDGEVKVRVRAEVVVNRMVEAMRDARLPLVPLDRDTTMVAFRTQTDRDETGRAAILRYLSDLPKNIEPQLGQVSLSVFAPDPNFVALKAPVTLRVRLEYIEQGHVVFRDVATQDVEPPRGGQPTAFTLCAAPARSAPPHFGWGGGGTQASSLNCRGVPASQGLLANIAGTEKRNEALLGEGLRAFVDPREAQRFQMRHQGWDVSPGIAFGIEMLDASGGVVAGAYNKVFTQCHRFLTSQMTNSEDWVRSGAFRRGGRLEPVVNLFDERPADGRSGNRPGYSPATCVLLQGGRYIGSARAAPEQRTMLALLPKAAVEQAANLRVVLAWD
jgi:hypothetical protein